MKTKQERQQKHKEVLANIDNFFQMSDMELLDEAQKRFPLITAATRDGLLNWLVKDELEKLEERY